MGLLCPFDNYNTSDIGTSSSHMAPAERTELEEGLLKIFEKIGVSIPTPVENHAGAFYSLDPFCMFTGRISIYPRVVKVPRDAAKCGRLRNGGTEESRGSAC